MLTSVNSISNFDAPSIIFITAGTYLVGKSISLSKPVSLSAGAVLKIASGVTVTFNSPVAAPSSSQIFSGPGAVEFGFGVQASVYVEWFGAKGNGATDDTAAINAALAAGDSSLNVMFQAKTYLTSGPLMVPSNAVVQAAPGACLSDSVTEYLLSWLWSRLAGKVVRRPCEPWRLTLSQALTSRPDNAYHLHHCLHECAFKPYMRWASLCLQSPSPAASPSAAIC